MEVGVYSVREPAHAGRVIWRSGTAHEPSFARSLCFEQFCLRRVLISTSCGGAVSHLWKPDVWVH